MTGFDIVMLGMAGLLVLLALVALYMGTRIYMVLRRESRDE